MTQEKLEILKNFISKRRRFIIKDVNCKDYSLEDFIKMFTGTGKGSWYSIPNIYITKKGKPIREMTRGYHRSIIDTIVAVITNTDYTIEDVIAYYKKKNSEGFLGGHYCNTIKRWILCPRDSKVMFFNPNYIWYSTRCKIAKGCDLNLVDILE